MIPRQIIARTSRSGRRSKCCLSCCVEWNQVAAVDQQIFLPDRVLHDQSKPEVLPGLNAFGCVRPNRLRAGGQRCISKFVAACCASHDRRGDKASLSRHSQLLLRANRAAQFQLVVLMVYSA